MYKYTLCFIQRNDEILMLNRDKPPVLGLWNGVGGKIEKGETPSECILREIAEETGLHLTPEQIHYKGTVSWSSDESATGGMHLFTATIRSNVTYLTPIKTLEGLLDWKSIDWLSIEQNHGVGKMIPHYFTRMIEEKNGFHHHFILEKGVICSYSYKEISYIDNNLSFHK
ncbi:8-oxo-dGTP diphosphatase [Bacillus sp. JRC01]|nr:8-oxo-dGTP diphosphatase [Bacillus sp. JRC01]